MSIKLYLTILLVEVELSQIHDPRKGHLYLLQNKHFFLFPLKHSCYLMLQLARRKCYKSNR